MATIYNGAIFSAVSALNDAENHTFRPNRFRPPTGALHPVTMVTASTPAPFAVCSASSHDEYVFALRKPVMRDEQMLLRLDTLPVLQDFMFWTQSHSAIS